MFLVTKHIFAVNAFSNEHIMRQACVDIAHVLNVDKHPMGVSYNINRTLIRKVKYKINVCMEINVKIRVDIVLRDRAGSS